MSSQLPFGHFQLKKVQKFLNSQMAIRPYTHCSAIHTQTQMQTESETFKTHASHVVLIAGTELQSLDKRQN